MSGPPPQKFAIPHWDNPEYTIVRVDLYTGWDWDDFQKSQEKVFQMVDSVSWPIDVIINTTASVVHPQDVIVRPRQLVARRHPRLRYTAIVLNTHRKHMAFNLLVRLDPSQTFKEWGVAPTLDDARAWLNQRRQ